jgi:hypothetical protein
MSVRETYGMLAEFETAEQLTEAAKKVREGGYTYTDAYSPYPLKEAAEALGHHRSAVPFITFFGGMFGAAAGFFMLFWVEMFAWPVNSGGRPLNSWPMYIPITFELLVLTASLSAFLGVFVLNRLPRYNFPLFSSPLFARSSLDRFYLCIEAVDPKFHATETHAFLASLGPSGIEEVLQ